MPTEKEIIENLKKCRRFDRCSANICVLDPEAREKTYVPGEDVCPFTIKKRGRGQKGIKTIAPDSILEVIPESNLKMLSRANQKRWHTLLTKTS